MPPSVRTMDSRAFDETNRGALFRNDRKAAGSRQPNFTGTVGVKNTGPEHGRRLSRPWRLWTCAGCGFACPWWRTADSFELCVSCTEVEKRRARNHLRGNLQEEDFDGPK